MKVVHVSFSDRRGGASVAAWRIHRGLRAAGVDSSMLVAKKDRDEQHILSPNSRRWRLGRFLRDISQKLLLRAQISENPVSHSPNLFSSGFGEMINGSDADVVHLHWLGLETLGIREMGMISKPIVWTMHDMWGFCGMEHYDDPDCPGRHRNGYHKGNRPKGHRGLDLDRWTWRRKRKFWKSVQLVSPSNWLAGEIRSSSLMGDWPVEVIPNGVDQKLFRPLARGVAREILNLSSEKRYILFGADYATTDRRKGFHLLLPALHELSRMDNTQRLELLVFGAGEPETPPDFPFPTHYMGRLTDEISLMLLYNAADLFVAPSMQDNLPNTLVEALSCGTPCVAFGIGGMGDLIGHRQNGYLASPFESQDLAGGLLWTLQQKQDRIRRASRAGAKEKFDLGLVAAKYSNLYQWMCDKGGANE